MIKALGRGSAPPGMLAVVAGVILAVITVASLPPASVTAAPTAPSFQESLVFGGLTNPTNVEFSPDGRVFVTEKSGLIKVFDNLSDTTPTTFADLRTQVHNFWDRGLLGLALAPNFPTDPRVYVLYTHDAAIGGTAPRWGQPGVSSDPCPTPPGPTADGCVVSGRLSELSASGDTMSGPERVLIEDWCQQYPSHSVGDLAFGADGALYVSGGDGASFNFVDYGQDGDPLNPCGDPPGSAGTTLTPPTAEGGALRSQDLRTRGDPVSLDGAILRVDPASGAALPTNPLAGNADSNSRRVIAYGLRNPFRFTIRPDTSEVWLGDVGWNDWEEINRIAAPADSPVENFGWPCYEGSGRQAGYDGANFNICENLYSAGTLAVNAPYYRYPHAAMEGCGTGSSSVAGLAFYEGGAYPDSYDGALFYADYARRCIWVMKAGANSLPDPAQRQIFVTEAAGPVDLEIGPNGDLFYVDLAGGTVRRIEYFDANQPPVARATASPASGPVPLEVTFDGTASSDPDGDTLTYAWDLDGDGAYDDSTAPRPTHTYPTAGTYRVQLEVTDGSGASDTLDRPHEISAGNTSPQATIDSPLADVTWRVGEEISFSGSAVDQQDGTLPGSDLSWALIMHHCSPVDPTSCHEHAIEDYSGVAIGSFAAPDHEYPAYLELRLTATDSDGLVDTESVRLDPRTATLTFRTKPTGLRLVVGGTKAKTPFSRTIIVGSKASISAPSSQRLRKVRYEFRRWSNGEARNHEVIASPADTTYRAIYRPDRRR